MDSTQLSLKVKLDSSNFHAKLPFKASTSAMCYDLFSCNNVTLKTFTTTKVSTGVSIEFPEGYGAKLESRSSLAAKGIFVTGGIIDSDYRGEIVVCCDFK
jgi:dUTP pyrophosphatase